MKNTPYVKEYQNGIVINPITKDKPFLVSARPDKRKVRLSGNGKGIGLIVAKIGSTSFVKYFKVLQLSTKGKLKTRGKKAEQYSQNRLIVNLHSK